MSKLIENSQIFENICPFPISTNRIKSIIAESPEIEQKIESFAKNTKIIAPANVKSLIGKFLAIKLAFGNPKEKALYADMSVEQFIRRLIEKRPLCFATYYDQFGVPWDFTMLRDKTQSYVPSNDDPWTLVGTNEEDQIKIEEYLTYDEMQISALLGVSVPTLFINNGSRDNAGQPMKKGTFNPEGVFVGLVGPRFQKRGLMESQHILVQPEYNTDKCYGINPTEPDDMKTKLLQLWAEFYGVDYFPTYNEIVDRWNSNDETVMKQYHYSELNGCFISKKLYKERIRNTIRIFLEDANARGLEQDKEVLCHIVGLGLGVWQIDPIQELWYLKTFSKILFGKSYPKISNVDFSWFRNRLDDPVIGGVAISFSKRNPADTLDGIGDKLVVAMYAWDSNGYPGNEYWCGNLTDSGDPAAASCSLIAELQNPQINPEFMNNINFY